jgi:hypothetical protein
LIDQCEAAERVEAEYGKDKALGYLIGEKLLNFLEVAESKPVWQAEVPHFIAKITEMFPAWQIAEFFEYLRRLGTLGHVADTGRENPMRLQDWETTIQEIVDACNQDHTERGGNRILMTWRAKLSEERTLQPQQIDEIIREARRRLKYLHR